VLFIVSVPTVVFWYSKFSWKIYYFSKFLFLVGTVLGRHACELSVVLSVFGHGGELQFSSVPIFVEVTAILSRWHVAEEHGDIWHLLMV
jgi:hypothetical protein